MKMSLFINLNSGSVMSALLQECNPSFPAIPIPIYAAFNIATSLAPSPIAAVVISGMKVYANSTISALSEGDSLQQTADYELYASEKNCLS